MRRFMTMLGVALLGYASLPATAQAQVIYVQQPYRTYSAPIVVPQAVVPTYYYAAPSVTTFSAPATYSYYPSTTTFYSASPSVVTYSAPVFVPAAEESVSGWHGPWREKYRALVQRDQPLGWPTLGGDQSLGVTSPRWSNAETVRAPARW